MRTTENHQDKTDSKLYNMLTTHKNTICNKENEGIKDSASNYLIQQGFDADPVKQSSGNNPLPIKCPGIKK